MACCATTRVPEPPEGCRIRIGREFRFRPEGGILIRDGTCNHEVRNDTDGIRVGLLVDSIRPVRPSRDRRIGWLPCPAGPASRLREADGRRRVREMEHHDG